MDNTNKFIPPSCIDLLYDYDKILKKDRLCTLPERVIGEEVAIIGAGMAGLIAAHELLKLGLKPVIYEASNRLGGRVFTKSFAQIQDDVKPFAELGGMRIPSCSKIFFHYARMLHLQYDTLFPNPGIVDTDLFYKNKLHHWKAGAPMPNLFKTVGMVWKNFLNLLIEPLHTAWQKNDIDTVHQLWQTYIDRYHHRTFYDVMHNDTALKTVEQKDILGAMGRGHGGFNPIFQISFLEILRVIANGYLNHLVLVSNGLSEFINQLFHLVVKTPRGPLSLDNLNCVQFNLPVVLVDYNLSTNNPIITCKDKNQIYHSIEYKAIIFTGSALAAQMINLTNKTQSGIYILDEKVRESIKHSPTIASSKTYICTETKFWKKLKMPSCILTDDLARATYFMDYPHTSYGVVCLSYTWGLDAIKLHAVDPLDRVKIFKRGMSAVSEHINKYLVPLNNEVINIDWINEKYYNGAFKIPSPGNEDRQKDLYYQFQSALSQQEDRGFYLAGDSISWSGGWIEGALYTGLNAVYAVAKRLGANIPPESPLDQNPNLYQYT